MTSNKDFKKIVRQEMARSGRRYTDARAAVLAEGGPNAVLHQGEAAAPIHEIPSDARIFVAGHRGLVGSALCRALRERGWRNLLTATRDQVDLRDQAAVNYWFQANRPDYVFLVAGTVGGIAANAARPAEFLYDNLMIHATVVHAAHNFGVARLLYLGSSCIYPRAAPQPISEDQLLTGPLEPTNEGYALAKIAGIKLCEHYRTQYGDDFIAAMPTNLYGPGDNFDDEHAHLVPALIRRFDQARRCGDNAVTVWGTGRPRRELLHVDDLADACIFLMEHDGGDDGFINVGTGCDHTVAEIATKIRDLVHPHAELHFDGTRPDGMPRKLLDVQRIRAMGWRHGIDLDAGLLDTVNWFNSAEAIRGANPVASSA